MTTTEAGPTGLVRVTVRTDERSADLALPSAVPVAELVPEIARTLGALDPTTSHRGFVLHLSDGRELSSTSGLTFQHVHDGAVLVLAPASDGRRRVYDDVVEAMADVVESTTSPWAPTAARRTALVAATALLALGALTISLERPSVVAGALAGVVALVLVTAAIVLARLEGEPEVALVLGWSATVFAAVGGFTALDEPGLLGWPLAAAGGGAAVAAALALVGTVERRVLLAPGLVVGALVAMTSSIVASTDIGAPEAYLTLLAVLTILSSLLPALSLTLVGGSAAQPQDPTVEVADPDEVSIDQVRSSAATGHSIFLALTASVGVLLLLVAPLAVTLGVTGALATVCVSVVLLARTRQLRSGTEVGVGLAGAGAGLLAVALSVLALRPEWRLELVIVLVVAAAATLVATLVRSEESVVRGRLVEVVELASLVALLPLLVIAVGIVAAVRS